MRSKISEFQVFCVQKNLCYYIVVTRFLPSSRLLLSYPWPWQKQVYKWRHRRLLNSLPAVLSKSLLQCCWRLCCCRDTQMRLDVLPLWSEITMSSSIKTKPKVSMKLWMLTKNLNVSWLKFSDSKTSYRHWDTSLKKKLICFTNFEVRRKF